ncbi:MAG: nucleoside triphosphate pyrophosphohydrolase [Rhizobiaceae bacterium]
MTPSRDISRLLEIMAALRDPQTGCPWDVVQTFETIAPYTLEEAYEVADAIERKDMADLADELGDLLLQVVFHARMAEELGHFSFGDVVQAITEKMIRRHPHVFGDEEARSAGIAKGMWNRIKAEEKADRAQRRAAAGQSQRVNAHLDEVSTSLPAMMQSVRLQDHAAKVGFDWSEPEPILDKIEEEIGELRAVMSGHDKVETENEFGDILFAMMNLGRRLGIDPESALRKTNSKFRKRFSYIEVELKKQGVPLENAGLSRMEALWQEAKSKAR